ALGGGRCFSITAHRLHELGADYASDPFDSDRAFHLVASDAASGAPIGGLRLLPTGGPHLLKDVYPSLAEAGDVAGDETWEVSRFRTERSLDKADEDIVRRSLQAAMCEFASRSGINRLVILPSEEYLPGLLSIGWTCRPLGLPVKFGDVTLCAV